MTARTREETAVKFADVVTLPPGVRVPEADASLPDALAFVGEVASALGIREFAIESPTYSKRDVMFRVTLWGDDAESGDVGDAPDLSHAAMLAAIEAKRGAAVSETKPPTQLDVERARKWLSSPMSNDMGPREFCALVNHVRVLLAALDAAEARADAAEASVESLLIARDNLSDRWKRSEARAETAERERDARRATLDGAFVVADGPETLHLVTNAIGDAIGCDGNGSNEDAASAVLAALREAGK